MNRVLKMAVALLVLAVGLTSCGIPAALTVTEEVTPDEPLAQDDDLIRVGFSQPGAESDWRVAHTNDVLQAFSVDKGYRLFYADARNRQENQIKDVRSFILRGVDYIILSPIVETGWDSVLQEAKDAGIPVIISDRMVDVSDRTLFTAYVGSDFKEEGRTAVGFVERYLELSMKGSKPFNIVHIQGTMGSSPQKGRSGALDDACIKHANWNVIARREGDFTKASGYDVMKNVLNEVDAENIDMIYCENDNMAYGVMDALDERHIKYGAGAGDRIMIISFDGGKSALERCIAGDINLSIECNPRQGQYLLDTIEALEKGESVRRYTYVEETFFIPDMLTEEFIESREY